MDIFLRDIDPVAVKKIDELAKKKQMSRNKFLKIQLHNIAMLPEIKIENNRIGLTLDKLIDALEVQQAEMKKINEILKGLTNLIIVATDMPDDQVDLILNSKLL